MNFIEKYKTDGAFKKKVNKLTIFLLVAIIVSLFIYLTEIRKDKTTNTQLGNVVQPENYVVPDSTDFIEDKSAYYGVGGVDSTNLSIPGQHNAKNSAVLDDYLKKREERMNNRVVSTPTSRRDYTPPINRRSIEVNESDDDAEFTPINRSQVVSQTSSPPVPTLSAEERERQELRERKLRLETGKSSTENTKSFNISINGTQTIKNGQSVAFRVLSNAFIEGREVKKNSMVYGIAKFDKYRVLINVSSVRVGNEIVPVKMTVYGMDGQPGIPISANDILDKSKDRLGREAEREIDKADVPGSRILTEIFTKNKDVEVKLINNHKLLLVSQ